MHDLLGLFKFRLAITVAASNYHLLAITKGEWASARQRECVHGLLKVI